jgi:NAD(P)-dependent dehydrogenase (short-subunit alcohol dehydrogenase family)
VTEVLRPGVLDGVRVRVAGAGPLGAAVSTRARALGAALAPDDLGAAPSDRGVDVLVVDAAAMFAGEAGVDAVRAALDGAWAAIQPAASGAKLILLLAPPPGDAHAEAARAGLENLARTLSIEWARLGIRPVAVHPGAATPAGEVAELAAFLASPAGAYYSGCRFDLR